MSGLCQTVVNGIERHQSVAIGIADVLRHGKGEVEHALTDTVGTLIERLRTIIIDKGRVSPIAVVEFTGDGLLGITNGGRHHTVIV